MGVKLQLGQILICNMDHYWFSPGSLNSPTTTEATRAVFATEPPLKERYGTHVNIIQLYVHRESWNTWNIRIKEQL